MQNKNTFVLSICYICQLHPLVPALSLKCEVWLSCMIPGNLWAEGGSRSYLLFERSKTLTQNSKPPLEVFYDLEYSNNMKTRI